MHHITTPLNHHIRDSQGNCRRMNRSHIVYKSQRKALQEPTQSIARANAKHCKSQRKALQESTQSIAGANAKHCRSQRKALQEPTQSIAGANAKHCRSQRKALRKDSSKTHEKGTKEPCHYYFRFQVLRL